MGETRKETVVVVHGTWAGPSDDLKWWQPPGKARAFNHFTDKLDAALARRGSHARCWAHCPRGTPSYSWTGANSWLDRTRASTSLLDYLKSLDAAGYRYHLVGHSHGGTVIADALPGLDPKNSNLGKVVTLGTPFIDAHGPIQARKRRSERLIGVLSKVFVGGLLAAVIGFAMLDGMSPEDREQAEGTISMLVLLGGGLAGWWLNRRLKAKENIAAADHDAKPVGLAITSPYDEARQVLHHLRETPNPLAVADNRWSHLWRNVMGTIRQKAEISSIHGVASFGDLSRLSRGVLVFFYTLIAFGPAIAMLTNNSELGGNLIVNMIVFTLVMVLSNLFYVIAVSAFAGPKFYSAFLGPFRWFGHRLIAIASIPNEVATMVVRRNAWRVLQTYALGLEGYAYELPRVGAAPATAGPWRFTTEDLSPAATERALRRRGDWLHRRLGDVSQALTALTLTATDIQVLLADISQDMTLVHAAYYTDDECIERIADWIAAPSPRGSSAETRPRREQSAF